MLEIPELLGDPQADVGRAGEQNRIGIARQQRGERGLPGRRREEGGFVPDKEIAPVSERGQRGAPFVRERLETIDRQPFASRERRIDDRLVAGAAAEIAGERFANAGVSRRRALVIEREQAHHDAGRAKAALRAVKLDHGLLDGMQRLALRQILDREHLGAVDLPEQQNAGIDRFIAQRLAAETNQDDRAGAAIALAATLLHTLRARLLAQPVQQGRAGRKRSERNGSPAKSEAQALAGLGPRFVNRHCRLVASDSHDGPVGSQTEAGLAQESR